MISPLLAVANRSVQITWQQKYTDNKVYFSQEPSLSLGWNVSDPAQRVKGYRLKVSPENAAGDDSLTLSQETSALSAEIKLRGPGKYIALIQAIDDKGKVVGNSEVKEFELILRQQIGAPSILGETSLAADSQGNVEVYWTSVTGAGGYVMNLLNSDGTKLKSFNSKMTSVRLSQLFPGRYQVEVVAMDSTGTSGASSERKPLLVPSGEPLQVPKIKRVSVIP